MKWVKVVSFFPSFFLSHLLSYLLQKLSSLLFFFVFSLSCLFFPLFYLFPLSSFLSSCSFHLPSFPPSFLAPTLSANIYGAPPLWQAQGRQVRSAGPPAPELCGFPPPLQALGTLLLAVPCRAGGRGGGEGGGGGQSGRESRVLPRHSPGPRRKGAERLLPSLRSPTPFIWSKTL